MGVLQPRFLAVLNEHPLPRVPIFFEHLQRPATLRRSLVFDVVTSYQFRLATSCQRLLVQASSGPDTLGSSPRPPVWTIMEFFQMQGAGTSQAY